MIQLVLLLGCVLQSPQEFEPGVLERSALPTSRAFDYEFNDVRISSILGWLKRVGVEPPVSVGGRVSGWLWAQAPTSGWWRVADYRVEGELTSPLLDIDRFSIRTARVRFGYRQGLWTIGTAQGQLESVAEGQQRLVMGQANIQAQLPMSANETARASGQLDQVTLSNLLATFGIDEQIPGKARGTFSLTTPLRNLSEPLAWQASGNIEASDLGFGQIAGVRLSSPWKLQNRQLSLPLARVTLDEQSLQLSAQLALEDQFAWSVDTSDQLIELTPTLYQQLAVDAATIASLPTGSVELSAGAQGQLTPWQAAYGLRLNNGQLSWLGNEIANLNMRIRLIGEGLILDALNAQVGGGNINGQAAFTSNLNEPVSVKVNYDRLDLSRIAIPNNSSGNGRPDNQWSTYSLSGIVSGQAILSAPKNNLTDLKSLALELAGTGTGVRLDQWGLGDIEYALKKDSGQDQWNIDLKDAGLTKRWQAIGEISSIADAWQYTIDAQGNALDLSVPQLVKLIGVEPTLPVTLEVLLVTGHVKFEGDTKAGLNATEFNFSNITTLDRDRAVWAQGSMQGFTNPQVIQLEQSHFAVGGSQIDAAITWNRLPADSPAYQGKPVPNDRLDLRVQQLTLETLRGWNLLPLPNKAEPGKLPGGVISARIELERPGDANQVMLANWHGQVSTQLDDLTLGRQRLGNLALRGELTPQEWHAMASGELLNADLDGQFVIAFDDQATWQVHQVSGNVTWLGAEIGRLTSLWQGDKESFQWQGRANVRSEFDWHAVGTKTGNAEIEIPQLAYHGRAIVRDLRTQLILAGDQLRIVRLDGGLGDGRVDVTGSYNLTNRSFDGVALNLERIDLARVTQLIDPELAIDLEGRADLRARVDLNRGLDLHGDLRVHELLWSGIPISDAHSDLEVVTSADRAVMRIYAHNVRGRAFGGKLDGDVEARLSTSQSLKVRVRIQRGQVEELSRFTNTGSVVGKGKFNGNLELAAPRFVDTSDLQGNLTLDFEDTDAPTLPISDQLARFVPLFGLGSTEFERGRLAATISRGTLRVRSLALWGRQLSVLGSGNVGLGNGRLDLQLVVRVGGGLSQQVAANYLTQLAATAVPPVELLLQINRLVANRAIFLRVGGTTSQPIIQPQTARIIRQALVRSLLEQAVGIPAVTVE